MAAHPGMALDVLTVAWSRTYVGKHYLVCYPFEGRAGARTLGMLIALAIERAHGKRPARLLRQRIRARGLGPCATWAELDMGKLFDEDMLGDDLDDNVAISTSAPSRNCAIIAGLIERRFPGARRPAGGSVLLRPDLQRAPRA